MGSDGVPGLGLSQCLRGAPPPLAMAAAPARGFACPPAPWRVVPRGRGAGRACRPPARSGRAWLLVALCPAPPSAPPARRHWPRPFGASGVCGSLSLSPAGDCAFFPANCGPIPSAVGELPGFRYPSGKIRTMTGLLSPKNAPRPLKWGPGARFSGFRMVT